MELIGLLDKITTAVLNIDIGRKSWATRGKAEEGRISYEKGISDALSSFKDAQSSADPHIIILVEYTFISQELEFCNEIEKTTFNSLTQAKQRFDEAFLVLKVVEDCIIYKGVDIAFPHVEKYRTGRFPRDAFHVACMSHKMRLQNIERSPGIDPIEKTLLNQRISNMLTAQSGYIEKQKKALESSSVPHSKN